MLRGNEFRERLATTAADVTGAISQRGGEVREQLEGAVRIADESPSAPASRISPPPRNRKPARQRNRHRPGPCPREDPYRGRRAPLVAHGTARVDEFQHRLTNPAARNSRTPFSATRTKPYRLAGTGKEIVLAIATQGARVNEALRPATAGPFRHRRAARSREMEGTSGLAPRRLRGRRSAVAGSVADRISQRGRSLTETISGRLEDHGPAHHRPGPLAGRDLRRSAPAKAAGIIERSSARSKSMRQRRSNESPPTSTRSSTRIDQTFSASRATALNEALVVRTGEMARVMAEGGARSPAPCRPAPTRSAMR